MSEAKRFEDAIVAHVEAAIPGVTIVREPRSIDSIPVEDLPVWFIYLTQTAAPEPNLARGQQRHLWRFNCTLVRSRGEDPDPRETIQLDFEAVSRRLLYDQFLNDPPGTEGAPQYLNPRCENVYPETAVPATNPESERVFGDYDVIVQKVPE